MSTNAYWRIKTPIQGNILNNKLKVLLARRYMEHDGSLCGKATIRQYDYGWLQGLRDAGVDGVIPIIEALDAGNEVEIWID